MSEKDGYGKVCNARFWPQPHEHSCALAPGHEGEHASPREVVDRLLKPAGATTTDMTERFEVLRWAGSRPGVLRLLLALKNANYDESGTEFLRRVAVRDGGSRGR